jgi:outer membrane protein OmpA-like peptidoglycan-associated protein
MKNTLLGIALLTGGLLWSCDQRRQSNMPEHSTADTVVLQENERMQNPADAHIVDVNRAGGRADWEDIDRSAPEVTFPEVKSRDLRVRGNNDYAIYDMEETVLFEFDKANIKPSAQNTLKEVASSIDQRYAEGEIRIYGHTDKVGSASYNKELAEERARAVKQWLVQHGNINDSRISIHPVGQAEPVASNETEEGRQQNRRVEIVARR